MVGRRVRRLYRLAVACVALSERVRPVVFVVEQVVGLRNPVNRPAAAEPEPTQEAEIHSMQRQADEVVARHDAAVRTQTRTVPAAVRRCESLTRPVEIQPAQLKSVPDVPDSIEHRPVALVRRCQSVLFTEVLHQMDRRRRRRRAVPVDRERVGSGGLPPAAQTLGERHLERMEVRPPF